MATVAIREVFSGSRTIIKKITAVGADSASEQVVIAAAETIPGAAGNVFRGINSPFADVVLMEAVWNINAGYDHVKAYWDDEGNDRVMLYMSGEGSYNARGFGGLDPVKAADVEGLEDEDQIIRVDIVEAGDEDAQSAADITMVFKLKDNKTNR